MGDAEERADEVGLSFFFEEVAAGARPWAGSCFCLQHLFPANTSLHCDGSLSPHPRPGGGAAGDLW